MIRLAKFINPLFQFVGFLAVFISVGFLSFEKDAFAGAESTVVVVAGSATFDVPCGVTSITVKAWGGGGGGGGGGTASVGGDGGGGGFSQATLTVTPTESLSLHVGGGGGQGDFSTGGAGARSGDGGGGGGRSAVLRSGTVLLVAAGGGGGGGGDNSSATAGGDGGPGGATSGTAGSASSTAGGGAGGTPTSGGTGGLGGNNTGSGGSTGVGGLGADGRNASGVDGSMANGGTTSGGSGGIGDLSNGWAGGGGGGSGYFGGGGGSGSLSGDAGGGGGGGGSSYVSGASTTTTAGSGRNAGNNGDVDYAANAGRGGAGGATSGSGTVGNAGRIVINYTTPDVDVSGTSNVADGNLVKIAINGYLCSGVSDTLAGGNFTISNANVSSGDVVTVWTEDGDGDITVADEATAITKYDGTGTITGMVLTAQQLVIGSDDLATITLSDMDGYDSDDDEDITYSANGVTLTLDASNEYDSETLRILSGNTLSMGSDIVDTFSIDIDGTLSGGNTSFNIAGHWDNSGDMTMGTSTVTFDGTADQNITSSGESFYNFTLNNTGTAGSDDVIPQDTLDINGNVVLTDGDLDIASMTVSLTAALNWTMAAAASIDASVGSITLDGNTDQTVISNGVAFGDLTLNNTGSSGSDDIILADNLDVNGNLTITNGDLDAESNTVNISLAGTWSMGASGSFDQGSTTETVILDGVDQFIVGTTTFRNLTKEDLTDNSTDAYLNVEAGTTQTINGTLNLSGLDEDDRINLNSDSSGSNFTFDVMGGDQTVSYVVVHDSHASSNDIIAISSVNNGGNDDAGASPQWVFALNRYWVGSAGGNTNDSSNWSGAENACGVGGGASVPNTTHNVVFSNSCSNNATVNAAFNVGGILFESGHGGTVTPNADINVDGPFAMNGGTLDFSINNNNLNVSGNFSKTAGTFTKGTGTVTFDGVLNLSLNAGTDLGDVAIDASPNSSVTLTSNATVDDLTIGTGDTLIGNGYTLDVNGNGDINGVLNLADGGGGSSRILVGGNWDMTSGSITNTNSTMVFDGTTSLTSAGVAFDNIEIGSASSGGSLTTADDMDFDGALTVFNGGATTLNIANDTLLVGGDLDFANLDTFTITSSTVRFNGASGQTIASNSETFNTIDVTNTSSAGVSFTEAFTTSTLSSTTPSAKMKFQQSTTFVVSSTLALTGILNGEIELDSIDSSTQFSLNVSGGAQTVDYVKVANSNALSNDITANDSIDDGGNDSGSPEWIFPAASGSGSEVLTVAGDSTFLVPCGVTSLTVKLWGGGGGGGGGGVGGGAGAGGDGGGGGYATAVIAVTPLEVLEIHVGGNGDEGDVSSGGSGTIAGDGGGGGGRSEIARAGVPLIIAAGGGGGAGGDNSSATPGGDGGAGGGTSGVDGSFSVSAGGGGGGTNIGGGAGGTGGNNNGTAGISLAGGDGANGRSTEGADGSKANGGTTNGGNGGNGDDNANGYAGGGGGGSGYYGGGGGSGAKASEAAGGGGGGGSSYLTGTSTSTTAGSGRNAGNNGDVDYAGNAGRGGSGGAVGNSGTAGNNGRIVINYIASAVDVSGTSDLADGNFAKLVIDGNLCASAEGTILSGSWTINNAPILSGDVVTVWTEDADGDIATTSESVGVTVYDGSGQITGMVLNSNVLSIGSDDNATVTLSHLGEYDNDDDEDLMHTSNGSTFTLDAGSAYTSPVLRVLASNTFSVGTETVNTHDMDVDGEILLASSTINVSGDWSNIGIMNMGASTVTFNGIADQNIASGSGTFNNFTMTNTGASGSDDITLLDILDVSGTVTLNDGDLDQNTNSMNVTASGNWVMTSTASIDGGTASVVFDGTMDQTITTGGGSFDNVQINNSGSSGNDDVILVDTFDVNGNLTLTDGDLDPATNSVNITLAGSWIMQAGGAFSPGSATETVTFDGAYQEIIGTTTFRNITKIDAVNNSTGPILVVQSDTTQTITGSLNLSGLDDDDLVVLRSDSSGTNFNFNVTGAVQNVNYVDVHDSHASSNDIVATSSYDRGGTDQADATPQWVFAINRYWVGSPGGNTSDASNWSGAENACGVGGGASVPDTTHNVVFSNTCSNNATVNSVFNVGGILIEAGHGGTITPSAAMDIDGPFVMNAGTIDFSVNNTNLNVAGNFTKTGGTFTPGNGTTTFDGVLNVSVDSGNLGDVAISASPDNSVTLASDIQVDDLTIGASDALVSDGYEIDINGNLDVDGTLTLFNGSDGVTEVSAGGNVDLTGGTLNSTGSVFIFDGTSSVTSASESFYDIQIGTAGLGGSLTTADNLSISNDFSVLNGGATTFDISSDTVSSLGDFNLTNLDTFTIASSTLSFDGAALQTVTSSSFMINTIVVTNTSGAGVEFVDAFTVGTLRSSTPNARMKFQQGTTFIITLDLDLTGILNQEIVIDSVDGSTQFTFDVPGSTSVDYVKVSNSNAINNDITANDSVNDGGNDDGTGSPNWIFPAASGAGTDVFTVAGSSTYLVPCGVTQLTVKAWGGGGGGGGGGTSGQGGDGGGAGYAQATLTVTPLEVLNIHVGGGGSRGDFSTGGGGASSGDGGGGGGRSEVARGATSLIVAAGGGGGGGGDNNSATAGGNGGVGGTTTGGAGGTSSSSGGGTGGTPTVGGTGGFGGSNSGGDGASLSGGDGGDGRSSQGADGSKANGGTTSAGSGGNGDINNSYAAGGGGGSGYFGGGGGSGSLASDAGGGGGGGGSSYVTGASTINIAGSGTLAGNNTDTDYAGSAGQAGVGGNTSANGVGGNTGRIVINYVAPAVDISGTSDLADNNFATLAINGNLCVTAAGTITGGAWQIDNAPIQSGEIVTLWTEDADGDIATSDESTAVTKYDGVGQISGVILNRNVLSVGSVDNQVITLTEMGTYDNDDDEDIMFTSNGGTLSVDAGAVYADETLRILGNNTLQVGTETVDTQNIDIDGTVNAGASTFTISGDWDNSGEMSMGTSTVTFDGTQDQSITSASQSFYDVVTNNTGNASNDDIILVDAMDVNGDLTVTNGNLNQNANTMNITLAGTWTMGATGSLEAGSSTATVTLDGSHQLIVGSTTFRNLSKTEASDDSTDMVLTIEAGSTQTISGTLTLDGLDANDRLIVRSDSSGTRFTFDVTGGAQTVSFLEVKDSQSSSNNITASDSEDVANTDSGEGGFRWIFEALKKVIFMVD